MDFFDFLSYWNGNCFIAIPIFNYNKFGSKMNFFWANEWQFQERMYYISHMLTHFLGLRNINFLTLVPTFVSILELQKLSTCVLKNILGTKFISFHNLSHWQRLFPFEKYLRISTSRSPITILDYLNDLWHKCWVCKYFRV